VSHIFSPVTVPAAVVIKRVACFIYLSQYTVILYGTLAYIYLRITQPTTFMPNRCASWLHVVWKSFCLSRPQYRIYSNARYAFYLKFGTYICYVVLNLHDAQNPTRPNQIALKWTMRSQTKACITKSSCVDKRQNRAWLKLTDTISIVWNLSSLLVWMCLLKMYALLASISRTQLITCWVGNRLLPYVNISNSYSPNPSPL
jgi:hypothetical protein